MNRWLLAGVSLGLLGLLLPIMAQEPAKPAEPAKPVAEADRGEGVSLTVYNQNFVVVKERRKMDFQAGRQTVRFKDVAATILPDTVQFSTLKPEAAARVVEQNYEFDLVSADKLLDKYIDQQIGLVGRDGNLVKGKLLSFDPAQLVLDNGQGIDLIPRGNNIKDIQFASLPGGLLTRPTLVWQVEAKQAGPNLVKVAYRAEGMSWHVNYTARSNADGNMMDLAGWVTLTNNTGASYKDAQLKLMAGDVNVIQPTNNMVTPTAGTGTMGGIGKETGFQEKSFAEYHLYELGRPTTVKAQEVKQIELMNVVNIPVVKKYAFNGSYNDTKVAVVLDFKNSKETCAGLGIPLPMGAIRVYMPDADKQMEFLGQDGIDHTPKDEMVQIRLGYAFDLRGERRIVNEQHSVRMATYDIEVKLRNHTDKDVKIDVIEPVWGYANVEVLKKSHDFERPEHHKLIFPIPVPSNSERVVTYTIRYTW
jgi:hypothetical protein